MWRKNQKDRKRQEEERIKREQEALEKKKAKKQWLIYFNSFALINHLK